VRFSALYLCVAKQRLLFARYRFGTKRVKANQVYQEYIQDKHHLHMNSTRWVTLTEFIKHLGRTGVARVDDTEKGWFIAWIDNSPKALAKAVRYYSAKFVFEMTC
jgi:Domain of Kin17 curved DNA-binding protein